jgi:osmotically-inducible protein OsmY
MQSSLQATAGQNGPSERVEIQNGPSERMEIASISEPRRSDDELLTRARSILRWKIRYNAVRIAAWGGHVILSGYVFSNLDREAAEHTIRKMTGVVTLTNRIVTTSPLICKHCEMTRPAPTRGSSVKEG